MLAVQVIVIRGSSGPEELEPLKISELRVQGRVRSGKASLAAEEAAGVELVRECVDKAGVAPEAVLRRGGCARQLIRVIPFALLAAVRGLLAG